jgi:hypothetical protein
MLTVIDYSREGSRPIPSCYTPIAEECHYCFESVPEMTAELHWEVILDQIMDDLGEIRDDDIDWGLSDGILHERMIAEWEASHFEFWRDDVETVGDFDSHLSWAEQD